MENISQMSLLEVAVALMEQKEKPQSIRNLIKEVLEIKGLDDADQALAAQLYIDITTSSKFVYMGNEEWDLKARQSLDEYDKDGSAFNSKEDLEEDLDVELEEYEEEDDDEYEDDLDEDEYEEDDLDEDEYEEDDLDEDDDEYEDDDDSLIDEEFVERYDEDDFNEDKYNDLMDDYEDMYE